MKTESDNTKTKGFKQTLRNCFFICSKNNNEKKKCDKDSNDSENNTKNDNTCQKDVSPKKENKTSVNNKNNVNIKLLDPRRKIGNYITFDDVYSGSSVDYILDGGISDFGGLEFDR